MAHLFESYPLNPPLVAHYAEQQSGYSYLQHFIYAPRPPVET